MHDREPETCLCRISFQLETNVCCRSQWTNEKSLSTTFSSQYVLDDFTFVFS